jgi:O-antigen ligase
MEHTYNFFKKASLKTIDFIKNPAVFVYLLSAILITLPLNFAFGSITCILFILVSFSLAHKIKFAPNNSLLLLITFYFLMVISLFWTRDLKLTLGGLKKEVLFLLMPLAFLFIPKLNKESVYKVFRLFSFSMVIYAIYYFLKAIFRYSKSGDTTVFFYHELVTKELNAIYVSVFASFALFYFIALDVKKIKEKIAIVLLFVLVVLLSSKNILAVDLLLILIYYFFFSDSTKRQKGIIVTVFSTIMIVAVLLVPKIRDRFLIEYQTIYTDNSINSATEAEGKVNTISLNEAWNKERFDHNDFFSGTALRLYQIRIFKELLYEENILFTGYGLEASQEKIREKAKQHNLYPDYGTFNFHNQYVQTFAELGIFGLLVLLLLLFINLKNALQNKDFIHIVFAVTMIMLFLTESFFCRQRGVIFFITLYCMLNTINNPKKLKI